MTSEEKIVSIVKARWRDPKGNFVVSIPRTVERELGITKAQRFIVKTDGKRIIYQLLESEGLK
jgi:hypothetical protein